MKRSVNILAWDNGAGLSRDIALLRAVLEAEGCTVFLNRGYHGERPISRLKRAGKRLHASRFGKAAVSRVGIRPPFALNIHVEHLEPAYFWLAACNVSIPNQEWFDAAWIPHLSGIDEVWAKTALADQLFSRLGCSVRSIGWTGEDRRVTEIAGPKELVGLHVAGTSTSKGTEAVLDVWARNPDWPRLVVLRRSRNFYGRALPWRERASAPNIEIITERVDEDTLRRLQNSSAIYVCPSQAEGFGHIVLEGLSVGGVVITTDAPPMNELVTPEAGLRVAVERSEPMGIGERYFVSLDDLERKIRRVLEMSQAERDAFGRAARERFEAVDHSFRVRIRDCLNAVFDGRSSNPSSMPSRLNER